MRYNVKLVSTVKAYVSIDLEGLPGVVSPTMLSPWSSQFTRASKIATKVANIVVDELFKNGFSEVVVADSHGLMTNLEYTELDGRASFIQGYPRPFSMVHGLTKEYNAVFYIGYHASAGTIHGTLEHTYNGRVYAEIRVNGFRASEYLINSLYAGEQGVPVALLAGDEHLRVEVERYTPWVVFVPLKQGLSRYSAIYHGITRVEDELRKGIAEASRRCRDGNLKIFQVSKPYVVELVFRDSLVADIVENWEIMDRLDAYTVRFRAESAQKMLNVIELVSFIGTAIEYFKANLR